MVEGDEDGVGGVVEVEVVAVVEVEESLPNFTTLHYRSTL